MSYYRVRFTYSCVNGHWNTTERGYQSLDDGDSLIRQFPQMLPCSSCPPATIVTSSPINVEFEISLSSEAELRQLGVPLEPDIN